MDREDRLLAYLQGKLPADDAERFEAEISTDRGLAAEVEAMRAIRAELAAEDAAQHPGAGWARLSAALDDETTQPANLNRPIRLSLWQAAGLVLASVLLWQFAVVPNLDERAGVGFQTASEDQTGPVLQVIFQDDASIGEISALLRAYDGTVLDGPSALGLYRIAFSDPTRRAEARGALADRPDLVQSVTAE